MLTGLLSSIAGFLGIDLGKAAKPPTAPASGAAVGAKPAAQQPDQPAQDPWIAEYQQSIDHQRNTAKWVLGVFAAVATVLLAGSQLSSIGKLEAPAWWESNRLLLAILSGMVGLVGAGVVVWGSVQVLLAGRASLDSLADEEQSLKKRPGRLFKRRPSADLQYAYDSLILAGYANDEQPVNAFLKAYDEQRDGYDKAPLSLGQAALDEMYRKLQDLRTGRRRLLWGLKSDQVRRTFRRSATIMFLAGTLAAGAIMTFAWAANPERVQPQVVAELPGTGTVILTNEERDRMIGALGAGCVTADVRVIVLAASNDKNTAFDVVSIPDERCAAKRFKVGEGAIGSLRVP